MSSVGSRQLEEKVMSETASAWAALPASIVTATVEAVHGARVDVRSPSFGTVSARLAVPAPYEPRPGDDVLVAAAEGGRFVIGVLRALRDVSASEVSASEVSTNVLVAPDGSRASLEQGEEGPVWRLKDREGRLIFEHLTAPGGTAKSVVHLEADLDVRAGGDLSLSAAGRVSIEGGAGAKLVSAGPVELASEGSALSLDRERASLGASVIDARADRADLTAKDANLVAGTLRSVIHRVREKAEVVERSAGQIGRAHV